MKHVLTSTFLEALAAMQAVLVVVTNTVDPTTLIDQIDWDVDNGGGSLSYKRFDMKLSVAGHTKLKASVSMRRIGTHLAPWTAIVELLDGFEEPGQHYTCKFPLEPGERINVAKGVTVDIATNAD